MKTTFTINRTASFGLPKALRVLSVDGFHKPVSMQKQNYPDYTWSTALPEAVTLTVAGHWSRKKLSKLIPSGMVRGVKRT